MSDISHDRFALPHEIPDQVRDDEGGVRDDEGRPSLAQGARDEGEGSGPLPCRAGDLRGVHPEPASGNPRKTHPAGRGWVSVGRDIGLPGEAEGDAALAFAAGEFGAGVSSAPLLFKGGDRGVVADAQASVSDAGLAHHPLAPSSEEEGGLGRRSAELGDLPTPNPSRLREGDLPHLHAHSAMMLHFTPTRRALFCDVLAACGNVRAACGRVGVSAHTAYRARRRDRVFSATWDAALVLARDHAEAVLAERALEGVEEAVFYHGEEVARRRRFDGRLLLAHLARLDGRQSELAEQDAGRFDALLAQLGGVAEGPLPDRADWANRRASAAAYEALREMEEAEAGAGADADEWADDAGDEELAVDPLEAIEQQARAEAEAEWDARQAAACDWVDGLAADLPEEATGGAERAAVSAQAELADDPDRSCDDAMLARLEAEGALIQRVDFAAWAEEGADYVPDDLPYEVKSWPCEVASAARNRGDAVFSQDPVTLCKHPRSSSWAIAAAVIVPDCRGAATGISWG